MISQPVLTTRTGTTAQPMQARPTPPKFMLAGREVSQEIYYAAHEAKRRGTRVFLVWAGPLGDGLRGLEGDICSNCEGYGRLALEAVIGGPFDTPPAAGDRGEGAASIHISAVTMHGKWFQVTRDYFSCPVCTGRDVIL